MNFEAAMTKTSTPIRDRELIRVDFAHDKLGIAAALRQAFAAAAQEPADIDFDKLLSELH
jgi:hypothetical protein